MVPSMGVVFASPITGQIRSAIQSAVPGQYRHIILGTVFGIAAVVVAFALSQIRDRRGPRYLLLASAVAGAVGYAYLTRTGNPNVDAVEWFHFVEYGILMLLFQRVWRERGDVLSFVFAAFAGVIVGTLDETVQWFVPARVGELKDVLLDCAAIACGLVCAAGIDPPRHVLVWTSAARRSVAGGLAAVAFVLAAFIQIVHLGFEVREASGDRFLSHYTPDELVQAARDRSASWSTQPPLVLHRLSREDQYLAEGIAHVQRRNEALSDNQSWRAWKENLILEKWFAPVLDFPSYLASSPPRWPAAERAAVASSAEHQADGHPFTSDANRAPIYTWNRSVFLAVSSGIVGVLLLAAAWPA